MANTELPDVPARVHEDEVVAEEELLTPGPRAKGEPLSETIIGERARTRGNPPSGPVFR